MRGAAGFAVGCAEREQDEEETMFDHVSVGVEDVRSAAAFYGPVLETLGSKELLRADWGVGYGRDALGFFAMRAYDGRPATAGNGTHVAFRAESSAAVDAFHAAALARGGRCAGAPGPREALGAETYAAFAYDPFGNKLEAIFAGFAR
jgi:catechol 2,3-dioxygenase-like lactoylglutathione lyase family enzyme